MTTLFLHVGPHKTGSTYVQKALLENRDYLAGLGVHYPNIGLLGQYGHHEIVEKIQGLEPVALERYLSQYLGGSLTFLSSENLDRLNQAQVQTLRNALAAIDSQIDVRVIYYYRNYMDLLPSCWQEEVKHGSTISFCEFALPHVWRPFSSNIVNPALVLDLYGDVFGRENIIVVDYDMAREHGNILHPLLELMGIDKSTFKNEVVNASLELECLEIIRALNAMAHVCGAWHFHKMRTLFLRKRGIGVISVEVDRLIAVIREHMKLVDFTGGFVEKLIIDSFTKKYEPCFFKGTLGTHPNRKLSIVSDSWMVVEDAVAGCERIYQHLLSGDVSY